MKTIVKKENNISLYLFEDSVFLDITAKETVVGDPPTFVIGDCTIESATLFEGVTAPENWAGEKYFYDGNKWTLNPDWVDPTTARRGN